MSMALDIEALYSKDILELSQRYCADGAELWSSYASEIFVEL